MNCTCQCHLPGCKVHTSSGEPCCPCRPDPDAPVPPAPPLPPGTVAVRPLAIELARKMRKGASS